MLCMLERWQGFDVCEFTDLKLFTDGHFGRSELRPIKLSCYRLAHPGVFHWCGHWQCDWLGLLVSTFRARLNQGGPVRTRRFFI